MTYPNTTPPTAEDIARALAANPDYQRYAGNNDPAAILNAYQTGNWSGVTSLTGKPFTTEQQASAVKEATKALAPAYKAQEAYDTANVEDALQNDQEQFGQFQRDQAGQFGQDKTALDTSAANNGILFSGARVQKQNDLRTRYQNEEADKRTALARNIGNTARDYQYDYGSDAARSLSSYYNVPGETTFNPGVVRNGVKTSPTLSSVYNPDTYSFQGTKPVAQQTAVQTRAANLLANRANKLTLSGVGTKF